LSLLKNKNKNIYFYKLLFIIIYKNKNTKECLFRKQKKPNTPPHRMERVEIFS
jgi:hypothetical protein